MSAQSNVRADVALGRDVRVVPLATELGIPPVTIYSMISRSKLEGRKIGRCVVVPNAEARRLLGMEAAAA